MPKGSPKPAVNNFYTCLCQARASEMLKSNFVKIKISRISLVSRRNFGLNTPPSACHLLQCLLCCLFHPCHIYVSYVSSNSFPHFFQSEYHRIIQTGHHVAFTETISNLFYETRQQHIAVFKFLVSVHHTGG